MIIIEDNRHRPWAKMMAYIVARAGGLAEAADMIGLGISTCSLIRAGKISPGPHARERISAAWDAVCKGGQDD